MEWINAVVLGLVQGVTEFLPVSSSGHLLLTQKLFGIADNGLLMGLLMHVGTVVAVILVFWRDIVMILKKPWGKLPVCLIIATIPAAVVGYLTKSWINDFFSGNNGFLLGLFFIVTAVILWVSSGWIGGRKKLDQLRYTDVVLIGLGQAAAVFPGISRSGATLSAGILCGLERDFAARFSLLMSIPIILGSAVFEVKDTMEAGIGDINVAAVILGMLVAMVAGIIAIKFLLKILQRGYLRYFSFYVAALGLLVMADQAFFHIFFA